MNEQGRGRLTWVVAQSACFDNLGTNRKLTGIKDSRHEAVGMDAAGRKDIKITGDKAGSTQDWVSGRKPEAGGREGEE